jgi:hypothetical protein
MDSNRYKKDNVILNETLGLRHSKIKRENFSEDEDKLIALQQLYAGYRSSRIDEIIKDDVLKRIFSCSIFESQNKAQSLISIKKAVLTIQKEFHAIISKAKEYNVEVDRYLYMWRIDSIVNDIKKFQLDKQIQRHTTESQELLFAQLLH